MYYHYAYDNILQNEAVCCRILQNCSRCETRGSLAESAAIGFL